MNQRPRYVFRPCPVGGVTDWIRAKIIPASAIAISFDSSDESVGSLPSRVILFGDIPTVIPSTSVVAPETSTIAPVISFAAPVVETTLVASPTGLCGLDPYSGSDSDSPDEVSSPEHISPLLAISPFLCIDSSEAPNSSDGPPSFPITPVSSPSNPGIHRWSAILIRPDEAIPFGRPYRTHLNWPRKLLTMRKRVGPLPVRRLACRHTSPRSSDHHSSSSSSSSDSSPCAASLSTLYPSTTSESSSGDSLERPFHSSSPSAGPSRLFIYIVIYSFWQSTMTNTRIGMTSAAIEEMINQRVDAALEARRVNQDLELKNGNGNGNGNEVVEAETEVYYPRNEIQKEEAKLSNLSVKNNDMATYTQRFQELTMNVTKNDPEE
ncbi:hypothetical protein Tco_1524763 [Tanacetum coccineum]